MGLHTPFYMQPAVGDAAIDYAAQEFRQYTRSLLTKSSGVGGEKGVTASSGFTVTQRGAGANLSVDVAPGLAFIVGGDVTNQGTYQVWSDATINVAGITVPASGTFHHRIELQAQDHLAAPGLYTGYQANLVAKLDTGGGLPAEDPSAITLATIDVPTGSASVTNSMINDYRALIGPVAAVKTGDTARTTTTVTVDPDLQLLNLQPSATYEMAGVLFYTGAVGGDLQVGWTLSGASVVWHRAGVNATDGAGAIQFGWGNNDLPTLGALSGTALAAAEVAGTITTTTAPCSAKLRWALNAASGTTTLKAGSRARAVRVA